VIESTPGDFEKILTAGTGSIRISPNLEIKSDGVYIYGRPPIGFSGLKNEKEKLEKLGTECTFKVIDLSAKNKINVFIKPINMKVFNQDWINYIFKLLVTSVNFTCNVVDSSDNVSLVSIDWLLESCYLNWMNIYNIKLNKDQYALQEKIYELQVISIIKEIISDNKIQTMGDLINIYNSKYLQKYGVPDTIIREVCAKHKIQKLLDYNTDISSAQFELHRVNSLLSDISTSAFNKFQEIYNRLSR